MIDTRESVDGDEDGQVADIDMEAKRWVAALTLTGLVMTILAITCLYVATTPRDVNRVCFEKKMNDEHTLMEASFQTPQEQNAVVEAMRACQ